MKILRDEHTEVLHAMFSFEKRNQELVRENVDLKSSVKDEQTHEGNVICT